MSAIFFDAACQKMSVGPTAGEAERMENDCYARRLTFDQELFAAPPV